MRSISFQRSDLFTGHDGPVYALERSLTSNRFFSGGSDRIVCEWSLDGSTPPSGLVNVGGIIYSIRLIEHLGWLAIGTSTGNLHIIDLHERREIRNIAHHQKGVFDITHSVALDRLYTASADGSFAVWRLSDLALLHQVRLCNEKVRSIAVHPNRPEIVLACGDGRIIIADAVSGDLKKDWPAHGLSANVVVYDPAGERIISGGRDAHLKSWSAEDGTSLASIPAHNYAIYSIVFSPDSNLLATGSRDKTVKLWDASSLEILLRIDREKHDGHRNSINKVLWLADPDRLVSTGDDRSVMTWQHPA